MKIARVKINRPITTCMQEVIAVLMQDGLSYRACWDRGLMSVSAEGNGDKFIDVSFFRRNTMTISHNGYDYLVPLIIEAVK